MIIKSIEEFEKLNAFDKGYFVYMLGARNDELYVPRYYHPKGDEKEDFMKGQHRAVIVAQDNP